MKRIIAGKSYNTETATRLFVNGTGKEDDASDWSDEFYVTKKGSFFKAYWGGGNSRYTERVNNSSTGSDGIVVLNKERVTSELGSNSYSLNEEAIREWLEIEEA